MEGLAFSVQGSESRVKSQGFRVQGVGCRVQGLGDKVQVLGVHGPGMSAECSMFWDEGFGCRVWG